MPTASSECLHRFSLKWIDEILFTILLSTLHTSFPGVSRNEWKVTSLCKCWNLKLILTVGRFIVIAFRKVRRSPYLFQSHVIHATKWIPHGRQRKREWFGCWLTVVLSQNECVNCDSMMLIYNFNVNIRLWRNSQVKKCTAKQPMNKKKSGDRQFNWLFHTFHCYFIRSD